MARSTPPDFLGLDQQLCFALYSASLAMTKLYQPLLEPMGLTYPQYLVLLVLWERDGLTMAQIGERLTLDSGTLSPLVKRLETAHLLRRTRDADDERRVIVTLTANGRALQRKAASIPNDVMCATACKLAELDALTTKLKSLRSNVLAFRASILAG